MTFEAFVSTAIRLTYGATMTNPSGSGSPDDFATRPSCGTCGGDGRINNSFGQTARCPSCHGTGRRFEDNGFHDVTKTKPSHHKVAHTGTNRVAVVEKQTWPTSPSGINLANEVRDIASLSADTKAKITRDIIEHESTHGLVTMTFVRKIRKQLRGGA